MIFPQPGGTLYGQIAAHLRKQIMSGRLKPGQPLPSERTLQEQFGVARETTRKAIAMLRSEGLVTSRRGHAVEVKEQPERQNLELPAGSSVIARMPTPEERTELELEDGVPVLWVVHPDGTSEVYAADQWSIRTR